jgi:MOSC domain-containing protein YiiM
MARLIDVRTGHARRVAGLLTAYGKQSRDGPVRAHALGLEGDEVANTRVHGGPEKAVYAYASPHYAAWTRDMPQHRDKLVPGGFGENLLLDGLDEESVCIGDRWRMGRALFEVCQPRQPCATLARWFDDPAMVKAMVSNGRSGWYLRVVEDGTVAAGDPVALEVRLEGAWSIARVLMVSYAASPLVADLEALAAHPRLAGSWAAWAGRQAKAKLPNTAIMMMAAAMTTARPARTPCVMAARGLCP